MKRYRVVRVSAVIGMYRNTDPTAWSVADSHQANRCVTKKYPNYIDAMNRCNDLNAEHENALGKRNVFPLAFIQENEYDRETDHGLRAVLVRTYYCPTCAIEEDIDFAHVEHVYALDELVDDYSVRRTHISCDHCGGSLNPND